jgi:hypothetical protein
LEINNFLKLDSLTIKSYFNNRLIISLDNDFILNNNLKYLNLENEKFLYEKSFFNYFINDNNKIEILKLPNFYIDDEDLRNIQLFNYKLIEYQFKSEHKILERNIYLKNISNFKSFFDYFDIKLLNANTLLNNFK